MTHILDVFRRGTLGIGAALALAGCQGSAFLSGAGSMRVDVEVYKGPLSKDPNIQLGEMIGLIKEVRTAFTDYNSFLRAGAREVRDCYAPVVNTQHGPRLGPITGQPRDLTKPEPGAPKDTLDKFCLWLAALDHDSRLLADDGGILGSMLSAPADVERLRTMPDELRKTLTRVSEVSIRLKVKAAGWAVAVASAMPDSYTVRIATSNFMTTAAEYANQLSSHADALLQQMAGSDRRELPMSVLLRDTTPTQFLNTYVWNRAAAPALTIDQIYSPTTAFSTEETRDRVRVIERLYADHHWTRINTAFATGQGDTSMAFIKDDIGNWNLKSFSNDPSDLLRSYRNLGFAGLELAATAIRTASTAGGGAAAASLLDTANRVALGRGPAPANVGGVGIEALHKRTLDRLVRMRNDVAQEQVDLNALAGIRRNAKIAADNAVGAARQKVTEALSSRPAGKSSEEHRRAAADSRAQALDKSAQAQGLREDAGKEDAANAAKASQLRDQARVLEEEMARLNRAALTSDNDAATAQLAEGKAEGIRVAEVVPAEIAQKKAGDDLASTQRDIETLTARRTADAVRILEGHIDLIGLMEQSAAGTGGAPGRTSPPVPAAPVIPGRVPAP